MADVNAQKTNLRVSVDGFGGVPRHAGGALDVSHCVADYPGSRSCLDYGVGLRVISSKSTNYFKTESGNSYGLSHDVTTPNLRIGYWGRLSETWGMGAVHRIGYSRVETTYEKLGSQEIEYSKVADGVFYGGSLYLTADITASFGLQAAVTGSIEPMRSSSGEPSTIFLQAGLGAFFRI